MDETLEKQIRNEVISYYKNSLGNNSSQEYFDWLANYVLGETKSEQLFQFLTQFKHIDKNTKILDIGCSFGSLLLYFKSQGVSPFGIEPDQFRRDIAQKRLAAANNQEIKATVYDAIGENMPFSDDFFDIVISKDILEHVSSPQKVLDEALRVLKPNGLMYVAAPNYFWMFKEPHYMVPWIPCFPKPVAKLYLKLIGKYTPYFDSINHITSFTIIKYIWKNNLSIISPHFIYLTDKIKSPSLIDIWWQRYIVIFLKSAGLGPLLRILLKIRFLLFSFVFREFIVFLLQKHDNAEQHPDRK